MDKTTLAQIKEKLQAEKEQLETQLAQFAHRNPHNAKDFEAEFPQIGDKEDENAAEVETYSTNLTLERTLESALRDVNKTLERIAKGTYGICKYCGKEIDAKRLLARPTSSACVECKKRLTQEA
jgi:DnaK suppressor protein